MTLNTRILTLTRYAAFTFMAVASLTARAQSIEGDTATVTTYTPDSVMVESVTTKTVVTRTYTRMPRVKNVEFPAAITPEQQKVTTGVSAPVPFSRDIENVAFVPKGQWIAGVSVSYSQSSQNNYQFLILQGLNGDTYSFKVSPMVMYAFQDNLAAGARFAYTRSRNRLDNAQFVLDSETSYDVDHLYTISHSYSGTMAFRNYLSLGAQTRFGLFNEVQIEIGGGQSKVENGSGIDYSGTFSRNFNLGVGLAPGLVMFLNNYSAIEVNVGVLGFDYKHIHNVTDQIYVSDIKTKSANFRVNLFSIVFGCTFYI